MKKMIMLFVLSLMLVTQLEAQPKVIVKKGLFSRIILVNGIRIKITRPLFRKKYRVRPDNLLPLPPEVQPYLQEYRTPSRSHEGFQKEVYPLYDFIEPETLRNLA